MVGRILRAASTLLRHQDRHLPQLRRPPQQPLPWPQDCHFSPASTQCIPPFPSPSARRLTPIGKKGIFTRHFYYATLPQFVALLFFTVRAASAAACPTCQCRSRACNSNAMLQQPLRTHTCSMRPHTIMLQLRLQHMATHLMEIHFLHSHHMGDLHVVPQPLRHQVVSTRRSQTATCPHMDLRKVSKHILRYLARTLYSKIQVFPRSKSFQDPSLSKIQV